MRKKRTFVKRDEGGDTAVIEAPEPEVQAPPPPRIVTSGRGWGAMCMLSVAVAARPGTPEPA